MHCLDRFSGMFWHVQLVVAKLFAFVRVLTEFWPKCRTLIRRSTYLIVENNTISTPNLENGWRPFFVMHCTILSNPLRQTTVLKSLTGLFQQILWQLQWRHWCDFWWLWWHSFVCTLARWHPLFAYHHVLWQAIWPITSMGPSLLVLKRSGIGPPCFLPFCVQILWQRAPFIATLCGIQGMVVQFSQEQIVALVQLIITPVSYFFCQ